MKKGFKFYFDNFKRLHIFEFTFYMIISDVVIYLCLKYKFDSTFITFINSCVLGCAFMNTWWIERNNLKINITNIEKMEDFYFKQLDIKYKLFLDRIEKGDFNE